MAQASCLSHKTKHTDINRADHVVTIISAEEKKTAKGKSKAAGQIGEKIKFI